MRNSLRALAAVLGLLLAVCLSVPLAARPARADTLGTSPGAASSVAWFNWVDHASPGMVNDNIHVVNPGATTAQGVVTVPGLWSATFSVPAAGTTYVSVPSGIIGGPAVVQVTSGPAVIASQRVQYGNSVAEIPGAAPAQALQHGWFPRYDRASPGTLNDNIHVVNPGSAAATGSFTLPGQAPLAFDVPAGGERYYNFATGTMTGPLHFDVTSGPAVIVSQRVQYSGSFNEFLALGNAQARSTLFFNWYDHAASGVVADNIHVLNPQSTSVNVTVGGPGLATQSFSINPGAEQIVNWLGGIAGPVRVDASEPVLATQRLQWPPSFGEWAGRGTQDASVDTWFPWYDDASPNFVDDIHVTNPGSSTASVTLALGTSAPVSLTVAAGADAYYTYPHGTMAGPLHVHVTSGPAVLAVQRAFVLPPPTSRTLNVPYYHQAYPLSCEEAALRMALAYEGVNVSEDKIFATMGIDYRQPVYDSTGFHWGDPYAQFVGDPNGSEINNTGYGSYNEAVARTATSLGGSVVASGEYVTPDYVYRSVLDGHPVVAWVSFDWKAHSPTFYTAFDGRWVRFGSPYEHAVTVIGVTPDSVLVNNPWQGQQWISKSTFEAAYGTFNDMAVVIR